MREKTTVSQKQEVSVVVNMSCDRCGKDMVVDRLPQPTSEVVSYDGARCAANFGYGSNLDLDTVEFDLCTECWVWFFRQLKHVVHWSATINRMAEGTWDETQASLKQQVEKIAEAMGRDTIALQRP